MYPLKHRRHRAAGIIEAPEINARTGQPLFRVPRFVKPPCTGECQNRIMQGETHHDVYRTWAELAEAAKTDEKAWLFLVNFAPWATRLLEEPTRH